VVRITETGAGREAELFASGPGIVGLAFAPGRRMIVATASNLYRLDVGVDGSELPPQ
jgi:hypothetical protein